MNWRAARRRTRNLLATRGESSAHGSRVISDILLLLILFNTAAAVLDTVPAIHAVAGDTLNVCEVISVVIFTVEYLARVWSCVETETPPPTTARARLAMRARYVVSPLALVDLIAIFPFYLPFTPVVDLKVLRLLQLFKLARHFPAFSLLLQVLRQEARIIAALVSILGLLVVVAASLVFLAENAVQPTVFPTFQPPCTGQWSL